MADAFRTPPGTAFSQSSGASSRRWSAPSLSSARWPSVTPGCHRRARCAFAVVALNPNHAPGVAMLGVYRLLLYGRPREALPYFDRAFRLSPRDRLRAIWYGWVGYAYVMLGDDLNAFEESKRSAAVNPRFPPPSRCKRVPWRFSVGKPKRVRPWPSSSSSSPA